MTTGAPIYLVSACTSGEEFVAAFRRYADRNGLFIPIAVPLPAGRRGRFAVTLKDGGVMIEGDADIVSSATTPSVLHGRIGMTLRFVEPDIKSKTVLVELEQARLAMKPQPPSVPPRPAQIPAEPRPKVPTLAGRIDANNALAECVAIGNVDALEATVPQIQKPGPKFVVPSIPPVAGARPKAPSTPPMGYPLAEKKPAIPPARPQTSSVPPPLAGPPPMIPPKPAAPAPAVTPMSITTIDAPIVAPLPSITPMSITTVDAPIVTPTGMAATKPSVTQGWDASDVEDAEDTGDSSEEEVEPPRDTIAMPAIDPGEAVAALARSRTASDELTAVPQAREAEVFQIAVPRGSDSDTFPAVQVSSITKDAVPEPLPESTSKPNGNSARMGLPPPRRTSGNTQPPPPRNPTPSAPLPVVGRSATKQGVAPPRAATQIGLPIVQLKTPAQPSGDIVLPPVVAPDKPKPPPELSDEPTDITGVPIVAELSDSAAVISSAPVAEAPPSPSRPVPGGMRKTVMGVAVVPEGVTVLPASPSSPVAKPTDEAIDAPAPPPNIEVNLDASLDEPAKVEPKLPGQRPPVIEEPSGDWTMIPGEAGPTIIPRKPEPPPTDSSKLPTGDWTIARVEDSPDGWSEPSKVDIPPLRTIPTRANTGPPVAMVAGEKPLEVTMTAKAFDIEEETKSGLKIEVDSSLGIERQTSSVDVSLASTQFAVPQPPLAPMTPPPGTLMPMAPQMSAHGMAPMARVPSQGSGSFPDFQGPTRGSQPADLFGTSALSESTSMLDRGRKKRLIIIAASAGAAIVIGVALLIAFGLGGDPKKAEPAAGSALAVDATPDAGVIDMAVKDPIVADAAASEEPDATQAAITPPDKKPGECFVEVTSTPSGAEIVGDKQVLGTTPAKLALPCGVEAKLVVRKAKYASSSRSVMPTEAGAKLRVALGKTLLSVKVTSSPPGATIMLAGKSLGVTPAVVKLPAQEAATLVLNKTGFTSDSQKITPKQNNQSVHVTLKKKAR